MGIRGRTAIMATVALAALGMMLLTSGPGLGAEARPEIPLSRALDLLESGGAQSARLEGGPGAATLVVRVKGTDRITALPSGLTERVIDAAQEGGVPLRVQAPAAAAAEVPVASGGAGFNI